MTLLLLIVTAKCCHSASKSCIRTCKLVRKHEPFITLYIVYRQITRKDLWYENLTCIAIKGLFGNLRDLEEDGVSI